MSQKSRVVVAGIAAFLVVYLATEVAGKVDKTNEMLADHMASMAEQRWLLMQICLEGAKDEVQRTFCTMRPLESHPTAAGGDGRLR